MSKITRELTDDEVFKLEHMSKVGLNLDQMAALLDVSPRTLDRMKADDPRVCGAIEKGRAKAIIEVGTTAFQQAVSGKVPAMTMFYLKCRAGWKETQGIEHSGPNGRPIETKAISDLSDAELDAKIQSLLAPPTKEEG